MKLEREEAFWEIGEGDLRPDVFDSLRKMLTLAADEDFDIDEPEGDIWQDLDDIESSALWRVLKASRTIELREDELVFGSDSNGDFVRGSCWQAKEMAALLCAAKRSTGDDSLFRLHVPMKDGADRIAFVGPRDAAFVDCLDIVRDPLGSVQKAISSAIGQPDAEKMAISALHSLACGPRGPRMR